MEKKEQNTELEQAAESYLMDNEHHPFSKIRDAFKAGALWQSSQPINSELTQLKAENERLKAELTNLKKMAFPIVDRWFEHFNDRHPDEVAEILKTEYPDNH
jgi:hypothetical protein